MTSICASLAVEVLLAADGTGLQADLSLSDGRIDAVGSASDKGMALDAAGLLVLPGIVDGRHSDAFERQIQPRPGVDFPTGIALRDTEQQLLANGITTAFHGVTACPGNRGCRPRLVECAADRAGGGELDLRHAGESAVG